MQLLEFVILTNMTACKERVALLAPICFTWSFISDSNGDKTSTVLCQSLGRLKHQQYIIGIAR